MKMQRENSFNVSKYILRVLQTKEQIRSEDCGEVYSILFDTITFHALFILG